MRTPGNVEAVDRLNQPDPGGLEHVVYRFSTAVESAGDVFGEGQAPFDQLLPEHGPLRIILLERRHELEDRGHIVVSISFGTTGSPIPHRHPPRPAAARARIRGPSAPVRSAELIGAHTLAERRRLSRMRGPARTGPAVLGGTVTSKNVARQTPAPQQNGHRRVTERATEPDTAAGPGAVTRPPEIVGSKCAALAPRARGLLVALTTHG
ncbi:hypothetical protein MLGJGCBP_04774 [Rhodococcus sp. T7]|nr:hypothetical protein MLGJGCBP_09208 [Rhodococcus sp. T7]KAF0962153.1 hypothetical protein MLGJGCBP_04774 [Rhodococcus sp. T7]